LGTALLRLAAGCAGDGSSSTVASATNAVELVLARSEDDHAQAKQCFDDFKACLDAAAGDTNAEDACRATLKRCLPARPEALIGPGPACEGDRGGPPPPLDGERRHADRPPPPDGGLPPEDRPPPPPDGGLPPDDHGGRHMHCGFGGP